MRDWLNRQSAVVVGVVLGLFFGVATFLVNVMTGIQRLGWASVIGAAIGAVVFGALMGLVVHRQRRKAGGASQAKEVNEAIKQGRLPQNAFAEEWGPLLERRRRQARLLRWLGPLEFGLFAALAGYLIVSDSSRVVLWVFAGLFFVGLAIWYPINSRRQLHSIQQLQQQLNTGPSPAPSASRPTVAGGDGEEVRGS